jgi:hypothetical protein
MVIGCDGLALSYWPLFTIHYSPFTSNKTQMNQSTTYIASGHKYLDDLYPRVKAFLEQDTLELNIDGEKVKGYRSPDAKSLWIRDHSDMLRGAKYFETDLKSAVDHFAATQAANGRIFDYVTTHPEKLPCEKENWTKYVRVPVEADVEYRFIKAAFIAWQATGDDEWILGLLPSMERALNYIFTNPQRVDAISGLVKRAYTIDTWDFAYTAGKYHWLQFQIDENTFWGIAHGDNSGYCEALTIMGSLFEYFGEKAKVERRKAKDFLKRAQDLKDKTNEVCWNGRFYTHFVKITPVVIEGVDEAEQLSLSNPMAINRGLASHEQAVSIIREYIEREKKTKAFAGWFSIEPPFPDGIFGDEKLVAGAYINGGIFPLVGGELALATFNHGFESYGVEILKKYHALISGKNETFLWYFPDGTPCSEETSTSPEAMPTDGWGSSAMVMALIEGLAGVQDCSRLFGKVRLSPRWLAAGVDEVDVGVAYGGTVAQGHRGTGAQGHKGTGAHGHTGTGGSVAYQYKYSADSLLLSVNCNAEVEFHVLINSTDRVTQVVLNGNDSNFQIEWIQESQYVNFTTYIDGASDIRITFKT